MTEYRYIETDQALHECCAQWQSATFLALDTEFVRTDSYYPNAGLLQLGVNGELFLIDPVAINDWAPFSTLMQNPDIVKVLHSCSEDLEVFQQLLGCVPRPLLDTQIGAALAGYGAGMSYQRLVMDCLDIHVEKGETRSDWLQRPLSESQCRYAALDVDYLQPVYLKIQTKLVELGRYDWWLEDCEQLLATAAPAMEKNADYYCRVKSAWKLTRPQLALLQALCEWREEQAQLRNLPRGWVLKDVVCFEIARLAPRSPGELAGIREMPPKSVRRYGETIVDMVEAFSNCQIENCPPPLPAPLSGEQATLYKKMKSAVQQKADELAIPAEVLLKKRDMEFLLRHGDWPEAGLGWRQTLLATSLAPFLCGGMGA